MRVNRSEFLQQLESVAPGLSPREIVEQSSNYAFKDGVVFTYNDEVACWAPSGLPDDFKGAVPARPLLDLLRKHDKDDAVELDAVEGELRIKAVASKSNGKKTIRWEAGVRMQAEIMLPVDNVEKPEKWKKLHEEFNDAVSIVQECAGKDESQFALTCVHVHPDFIEACDNFQMSRYRLKTGVGTDFLVRRESLKHILALDMTKFSETKSWVHFSNPAGLVLSCRRYVEEFPDLAPFLKVKGAPATLPRSLGEAAETAEIFSGENADNNKVLVQLRPGRMRVRGDGASGWYRKPLPLKYDGPTMEFMVSPKLLVELTARHLDCEIAPERLMVNGGRFRYVTCLSKVEQNGKPDGGGE